MKSGPSGVESVIGQFSVETSELLSCATGRVCTFVYDISTVIGFIVKGIMLWVSQAWTEILIVVEMVIVVDSTLAVTVLVWVKPFFVESFVLTVITYPAKLKKSVSVDDRVMVEGILGQFPERFTVFGTVSSISMSARVKNTPLDATFTVFTSPPTLSE